MKSLLLALAAFGLLAAGSVSAFAKEPSLHVKSAVYSSAASDKVEATPVRWRAYYGPPVRYYGHRPYYYRPYRATYYGPPRSYWNRGCYDYSGWYGYPYGPSFGFRYYGPRAGFSFGF